MIIHPLDVSFDWKKSKLEDLDFSECTYLEVWHHSCKEKNFSNLPEVPNLKTIVINFTNTENLCGLEKYPCLERIELYYCRNMKSLEGIEYLSKKITFFQLDYAKKLSNFNRIVELENIENLRYNESREIENINFILKMKKLRTFCFVNTNIVDGNLSPLLEHQPKLSFVGFIDKRHYSHKSRYIEEYLGCYKESSAQTTIITLDNTDK